MKNRRKVRAKNPENSREECEKWARNLDRWRQLQVARLFLHGGRLHGDWAMVVSPPISLSGSLP